MHAEKPARKPTDASASTPHTVDFHSANFAEKAGAGNAADLVHMVLEE